jgi:peptidoglycan/LPS O-acetylase OafA/YrhL
MRLVLSSLVVWTHTINVVLGADAVSAFWSGPARPPLAMILGMFFALSGFLVAGSLERCRTMVSFLGLRLVRLVPALAVDTIIAALILGPLFTVLSLQAYFSSPVFWKYFLNIIGHIQFHLPGVFELNPRDRVNGQLWTLPYELKCYFALTLMAIVGVVRYRWLFLLVTLSLLIYLQISAFAAPALTGRATLDGSSLVMCFLLGVCAYILRDRVVLSAPLCLASFAIAFALLSADRLDYMALIPIVYVTVYLGLLNPHRLKIVSSGDYSYGIFLYGWPIQQAVYVLLGANPWLNLLVSYPIVVALAVASWFFVEKPALRLRSTIFAFEKTVVGLAHRVPLGHWMVQPPVGPWLRRPPVREDL